MKGILFGILFFIVVTLFMPMLIVTSCNISIPNRDRLIDRKIVESDLVIPVYNHSTDKIMNLELEEYIIGVVAAEAPAAFEIEALKAQAVAARSYALWRKSLHGEDGHPSHPGAIVCTSHTHCQEWLSYDELKERHGNKWIKNYLPKIEEAVMSTKGVIMTYNMKPIEPLYHSTSGGRTENAEDVFSTSVPYLKSVPSPYEEASPVLIDQYKTSIKDFVSKLENKYKDLEIDEKKIESQIDILQRSSGGTIKKIKIGNKEFTGREIRELFKLRSANFTIEVKSKDINFTTKGYGHGVGMSQWGANGMAKEGSTFNEILKHYYQGVSLSILKTHS